MLTHQVTQHMDTSRSQDRSMTPRKKRRGRDGTRESREPLGTLGIKLKQLLKIGCFNQTGYPVLIVINSKSYYCYTLLICIPQYYTCSQFVFFKPQSGYPGCIAYVGIRGYLYKTTREVVSLLFPPLFLFPE